MSRYISISSVEALPEPVIQSLVNERVFWKDLEYRLRALPKIPIGEQVAKLPENKIHENAIKYTQEIIKAELYIGYIIFKESLTQPWQIQEHSFPVEKGRVMEVTDLPRWNRYDCHYIGMKVPETDIKNQRYLYKFALGSYIQRNSPLGRVVIKNKNEDRDTEKNNADRRVVTMKKYA